MPLGTPSRLPALAAAVTLLGAAWLGLAPSTAQGQGLPALTGAGPAATVVTTPQVRAELVAHAPQGIVPGQPVWLGLEIRHQPHWHTYWKNPGDSGLPTTLQWTLPAGVEAGDITWPTPQRLPFGPLVNYGYEDRLLLPVPLAIPAGFDAPTLDVSLRADWLVCKDVCIPESGEFRLSLPARASVGGEHAQAFADAQARVPQPLPAARATSRFEGEALALTFEGLPEAWRGRELTFFSEAEGVIDHAAAQPARWDGARWTVSVPLSSQRSESPSRFGAVLVAAGEARGVQVNIDVAGPWPKPGAAGAVQAAAAGPGDPSGGEAAAGRATSAPIGLVAALVLAFGGGLLLNLMPCVFPVLSLKVFGFAAHAHDRRALLAGGLAYTAGVVLSFLALAGLLLALRAGGEQLGWGFQLQSPVVVAALALLFTLIGLNLAGVYAFGSVLPSGLATARARHPVVDSLLTGVLAVAVASPCTAPFMGASLGLAMTLPTAQALAVFAALGLGMALPYLAASAWPGLARRLPRPGAWMQTFKVVMAFPMFATVVWLAWVLGQQSGIDAVAALLALLLAVAFAVWALGSPMLGRTARVGLGSTAVALLAAALAWGGPLLLTSTPAQAATPAADARWQPWDAARVAELRAQGTPVFVDFTAAWCVTCQFNKRTTLADDAVLADFAARQVVLMRADWTRRDPAISRELGLLGRSGVPVYALYAPGGSGAPQLLPEILSAGAVRDALAGLRAD